MHIPDRNLDPVGGMGSEVVSLTKPIFRRRFDVRENVGSFYHVQSLEIQTDNMKHLTRGSVRGSSHGNC